MIEASYFPYVVLKVALDIKIHLKMGMSKIVEVPVKGRLLWKFRASEQPLASIFQGLGFKPKIPSNFFKVYICWKGLGNVFMNDQEKKKIWLVTIKRYISHSPPVWLPWSILAYPPRRQRKNHMAFHALIRATCPAWTHVHLISNDGLSSGKWQWKFLV